MADKPDFGTEHLDDDWGCSHTEITSDADERIIFCHVHISDLEKIALELTRSVMDSSWIMDMDVGAQQSYVQTVTDTANSLVEVFNAAVADEAVSGEFGELMVSMGCSRALNRIFEHISVPISELWKPQRKQNEGFDFHTVCGENIINFGEAKFKSRPAASPVADAAKQANRFFSEDKHFRDRVHLINLVHADAISNLDGKVFGMVIAFSMNAKNPLTVYKNAVSTVESLSTFSQLGKVYVVGVSHEP